jgi:hypothetical protein
MPSGGVRKGQGRPKKADEERVRSLSVNAIVFHYGSEDAGFAYLLASGEPVLIKWVFEHAYGKPIEKMEVDQTNHFPNINLIMPEGE